MSASEGVGASREASSSMRKNSSGSVRRRSRVGSSPLTQAA